MITKSILRAGYNNGLVRIVDSPNGDGAVCQIGDGWFYFGGEEAESVSAADYVDNVPIDDILSEIHIVLTEFFEIGEEFADEYAYYESYLLEQGIA